MVGGGGLDRLRVVTMLTALISVTSLLVTCSFVMFSYAFGQGGAPVGSGNVCVPPVSQESLNEGRDARPAGRVGGYTGSTHPLRVQTVSAHRWSDVAHFDLTDEQLIPPNAIITGVHINYAQSSGSFSLPHLAIVDEAGRCYYVNRFNRNTAALNGQLVRQRWRVAFWTEAVWSGPARIWPQVTMTYEY